MEASNEPHGYGRRRPRCGSHANREWGLDTLPAGASERIFAGDPTTRVVG
jgi:hypothetical protein